MAALKLPQFDDSIAAATVRRWLVNPGDDFAAGTLLVELEAEETFVTVAADVGGVLVKQLATVGQTLSVGAKLGQIETRRADPAPPDSGPPLQPHSTTEQVVNNDPSASAAGSPTTAGSANASTAAASTDNGGPVEPILMPLAGNTMEEGTVLEWRVQEGDMLGLGQILCEIETDKATIEYESPVAGRLARIVAPVNEPVAVKALLAVVADNDAAADAYLASQGAAWVATETAKTAPDVVRAATTTAQASSGSAAYDSSGRISASPAARRLAAERGLSLETVGAGSGPGGRILSTDLARATAVGHSLSAPAGVGERRPMSKMRRAIGANLQRSKQTVPHFYLRITINAAPLQEFYQQHKPLTDCSLNDLVVLAVGRAMRDFPEVRSQIDGDDVVEFPHANIGIAVGVEDGLVVPVVLNVDRLSLTQLSQESKRVVTAGRQGVLENFGKGNFTISNLGMFGVEEFSAIINPPESGILAVSAVRETVLVENGSLSAGQVMTMTLSADHRVVDGLVAAKFMGRLQVILENPTVELS